MRVLVLTADLPPHVHSGVGTAVAYSAQALMALGFDVEVLTTAPKACVLSVKLTYLDAHHFPAHLRGRSVVHLHSLRLADLAFELKRRDGSALLYTAHALLERELEMTASSEPWRARQRKLFEQADHVIFLSHAERFAAIMLCPSVAARSTVLPNAISAASTTRRPAERSPLVLFAGRFCLSKGVDVAVAAMKTLLHRRADVRCAFVGGRGEPPYEALVTALTKQYPGRCISPGWLPQTELQAWIERASLLVMPSRYEPFGMVALEALRVGLPVLGADIVGLRELLAEDSGGATVHGHDPEDWADAVAGLLDDPCRMQQMQARGPLYVQAHYSLETHGQRYVSVLRRCMAELATQASTQPVVFSPTQRAA